MIRDIWRPKIAETLMLVFMTSALLFIPYTYYWTTELNAVYSYVFMAAITSLCALLLAWNRNGYKLQLLDVGVYASGLVVIVSGVLTDYLAANEQLKMYILACALYFVVRLSDVRSAQVWLAGLGIAFIAEFAIGIKQVAAFGILSPNSAILLKGTLDNAGQYACFMMLAGGLLFFRAQDFKKPLLKHALSIFILLIVLGVVLLTRSRGCLLAVIVCGAYSLRHFIKAKVVVVAGGIIGFLAILVFLFFFKENSSLGRVLIWKVSFDQSLQQPLTGIGYGRFPIEYGKWQSAYFSGEAAGNRFSSVADMNYEMFNEPLQVFVETGLVGLLVFLFVLYACLALKGFQPYRIVLAAALIFSLFSYPFHSTPNLFLVFICLGMLANTSPRPGTKTIAVPVALTLLYGFLLVTAFGMLQHISAYRTWAQLRKIGTDVSVNNVPQYAAIYPQLSDNGIFLNDFAKTLFNNGQYEQSISMMDSSKRYFINEATYEISALAAQKLGRYEEAQEALSFLTNLIPSRFRYRYLLARMYMEKGDRKMAEETARNILSMPVKINSDEVENIRYEAEKIVNMSK